MTVVLRFVLIFSQVSLLQPHFIKTPSTSFNHLLFRSYAFQQQSIVFAEAEQQPSGFLPVGEQERLDGGDVQQRGQHGIAGGRRLAGAAERAGVRGADQRQVHQVLAVERPPSRFVSLTVETCLRTTRSKEHLEIIMSLK